VDRLAESRFAAPVAPPIENVHGATLFNIIVTASPPDLHGSGEVIYTAVAMVGTGKEKALRVGTANVSPEGHYVLR
jgi:hypothetical protein